MRVQLLFFQGCPHVDAARETLQRALAVGGAPEGFEEIDVEDAAAPTALRGWGSPTILIDGRDVASGAPGAAPCCRVYPGSRGAPSEAMILRAIERAKGRHRLRSLALLPAALLSLLPAATCPACWGAWAGLLSAAGLGFLFRPRVFEPLLAALLAIGVAGIAWSTRSHRRPGPIILAAAGSAGVFLGRLVWDVAPAVCAGAAALLGASLWNLWLKRPRRAPLVRIRSA